MSDVKVWRLISGEEIIGKDISDELGFVKIDKPASIQMVQGPNGQPQMGMGPMLPMSKNKEVMIGMDKVVFSYDPVDELRNEYAKNFGTGVLTSTSQLIS